METLVTVKVDFAEATDEQYDDFFDTLYGDSVRDRFMSPAWEIEQAIRRIMSDYGLLDLPGCKVKIEVE